VRWVREVALVVAAVLALLVRGASAQNVVEYDLVVDELVLAPAGKATTALAFDGTVPGPVLRFTEGDVARVRVTNRLEGESTSVHWHGILLPLEQDGVPHVTTPPIEPGATHTFEFPLRQSGTYWYHSHSGLQEQRGLYGAIVVLPREPDGVAAERDDVLVLSDWTDESPEEVLRTLRRGSDAFAAAKGNVQSLLGAWRAGALSDWWMRERMRMPPMDLSDVAYSAFLANGARHSKLAALAGERVRLRIVNAAASTYFYVSTGAGPLTVVGSDGQLCEPFEQERLFIGVAETYDVVVRVPESGALEVRATAQDGSGHALLTIGDGVAAPSQDPPRADLYRMDDSLVGALDAARPFTADVAPELPRPPSPYRRLVALEATDFDPRAPVRELDLRLTGDMLRYEWGFDGRTFAEAPFIGVRAGEVVRITLHNDTMMNHPIHLHGHFFRVLNGWGARSPLKHTVDVPPMGRRTIEFLADEPGDWLLHCHVLYHMHTGMTRVVTYREPAQWDAIDLGHDHSGPVHVVADGLVATHMVELDLGVLAGDQRYHARLVQEVLGDREREFDLGVDHLLSTHWWLVGGLRTTNEPGIEDRFFAGAGHRLPWFVEATLTVDTGGDVRARLAKELQLTDTVRLDLAAEYDTQSHGEVEVALVRRVGRRASLVLHHHSDYGTGVGLAFEW
jgi:FtsP/CotA-like multicopper oxidase with cupredoxin domain